jgi:hypothetical protein
LFVPFAEITGPPLNCPTPAVVDAEGVVPNTPFVSVKDRITELLAWQNSNPS